MHLAAAQFTIRMPSTSTVLTGLSLATDIAREATRPVLAWLRRQARGGAAMGAVCTGTWILAEAGLLDGRKATIHWENHDGLAEAFPEVDLFRSVFVHDGNRLTAAGAPATGRPAPAAPSHPPR